MTATILRSGPISGTNHIDVKVVRVVKLTGRALVEAVTGYPFDITRIDPEYDVKPDSGAQFTYWSNRLWIDEGCITYDNATLQARAQQIAGIFENEPVTKERAAEYLLELAEISNALQRDGEAMSDYGDARREAKFGESL